MHATSSRSTGRCGAGWNYSGIKVSSTRSTTEGWLNLEGSIKYNFNVFRLGVIYALP